MVRFEKSRGRFVGIANAHAGQNRKPEASLSSSCYLLKFAVGPGNWFSELICVVRNAEIWGTVAPAKSHIFATLKQTRYYKKNTCELTYILLNGGFSLPCVGWFYDRPDPLNGACAENEFATVP